jgi:co-chaperonin GroES (HSP10)
MSHVNTTIIPLGDRLIVRLVHAVSQSGAPAAEAASLGADAVRGVVIAAGSGRPDSYGQSVPLAIAAGDIIHFRMHLGHEMTFGGMRCWMINAADIVKVELRSTMPRLRGDARVPDR